MTGKRFLIICLIWVVLGITANYFAPIGYGMAIICAICAPIFLFGFFYGIYNMIKEHYDMKKERERLKQIEGNK